MGSCTHGYSSSSVADSVDRTLARASELSVVAVTRGELARVTTARGHAVVDLRTGAARLSMTFTKLPPPGDPGAHSIELATRVQVVVSGQTLYVRAPGLGALVGATTTWVGAKTDAVDPSTAELLQGRWAAFEASWIIASLRGVSGGLSDVGGERMGGVATTHYRATLRAVTAVERAPAGERRFVGLVMDAIRRQFGVVSFPVDFWVDPVGLIRQVRYSLRLAAPAGTRRTTSVSCTVQVVALDGHASVSTPPPGRVTDVTDRRPSGA
jgi:hypothetical protein